MIGTNSNLLQGEVVTLPEIHVEETLHETLWNAEDLQVSCRLNPGSLQGRSPVPQHAGLVLPVRAFGQSSHYKYMAYGASETAMVRMSACQVCDAEMIDATALVDRQGRDYLKFGFCPQCGFFQHTQRPPREWYREFYKKMWDPNRQGEADWPASVEPNMDAVHQLFGFIRPGQRVLEFGAGWGSVLQAFKTCGFPCVGVEASEHRAAFINKRLGIECVNTEAENLPIGQGGLQRESFDLIYSYHVLEHVYQPRQVLEHLRDLLKPDGLAFLSLPCHYMENLTENAHEISHTCSFGHANFDHLLQRVGFEIVRDFSSFQNLAVLVKKSPPMSEARRVDRLRWMSTFLPHRSLAYLLEGNGLARVPSALPSEAVVDLKWYHTAWGRRECYVHLDYVVDPKTAHSVGLLREIIRKRAPIETARAYLPMCYTYDADAVPIWYY